MAQTKKRRRKKHRGTQAGTVARPTSSSSKRTPSSKAEGKAMAQQRRDERLSKPPSWRSAMNRAAFAALLFFGVAYFLLDESPAMAAVLSLFALVLYIPAAYYTDSWRYRRYTRARGGSGSPGGSTRSRGN